MMDDDQAEASTAEKLDADEEFFFETMVGCMPNCPCSKCHARRRAERQVLAKEAKRRSKFRLHSFKRLALREQRAEDRRMREDAELAKAAWERGDLPVFFGDERVYE